jgi:repressor LexA
MSKDINIEYLKIGRLIKNRREALGLSQQDVANHVNVTKSAISRWESGEVKNMGRSKIQKLAEVLKLSPVDIVLRSQHRPVLRSVPNDF